MDISTLWIQILSYAGTAIGALASGAITLLVTSAFPDMPPALSTAFLTIGTAGPGYFLHHYLDGLLKAHTAAISTAVATAQFAPPSSPIAATINGHPIAATVTAGIPISGTLVSTLNATAIDPPAAVTVTAAPAAIQAPAEVAAV